MTAFFQQESIPIFAYLSPETKQGLEHYFTEGNQAFREKKALEFFKSLDWLPLEDIGSTLLEKIPPLLRQQIHQDVHTYLSHKAQAKQESAQRRKAHQIKVYEYFRTKVPTSLKVLLEELRDYELELTGRDINWQHYFSFKSFKKIDELLALSAEARMQRIQEFRHDVNTYKSNYEKLHEYAQWVASGQPITFSFDDWCDWREEIPPDEMKKETRFKEPHSQKTQHSSKTQNSSRHSSQSKNRSSSSLSPNLGIHHAYQSLGMAPGTSFLQVRKQFRALTLLHHPDMPTGNAEKMKTILSAYEQLKKHFLS